MAERTIEHVSDHVEVPQPPTREASPASPAAQAERWVARPKHGPPGWPATVPPPGADRWLGRAEFWLMDQCPPDYRAYPSWKKHRVALAWLAVRHLDAQIEAMRLAYREVRVALVDDIGAEGVAHVLEDLEAEGVRLMANRRAAGLILDAMRAEIAGSAPVGDEATPVP